MPRNKIHMMTMPRFSTSSEVASFTHTPGDSRKLLADTQCVKGLGVQDCKALKLYETRDSLRGILVLLNSTGNTWGGKYV